MKKLTILSLSLLLLGAINTAKAQTTFEVNYQTSLPLGDLSKEISNYSWRGMGMEYQYFVTDYISVGGAFAWNTFHDSGAKNELHTTNRDGLDLTVRGKKYDYVNTVPFMALFTYHVGDDFGLPRPFIGVGLGGTWIENRVDLGLFTEVEKNVHFNFNPRIGLNMPAGNMMLVPSISYNLAPGVKDSPTYQYMSFNLGLKFQ